VLGETCNFLRNNVRNGSALEVQFLSVVTGGGTGFEIINPTDTDRRRAAELSEKLVSGPLGYVDGIVIATAERLGVTSIATIDFKFLGMATPVSRLKPINWVLQEH
jgi:predicted nucleic acid-binding protein